MRRILLFSAALWMTACENEPPADRRDTTGNEDQEDPTALEAPVLTATARAEAIDLDWTAVEGATGYVLRRTDTAGGPYTEIYSGEARTFADEGHSPGTTFHYVVRAKNADGEGPDSAEASATVKYPAAAAPATVAVVGADASARLYWAAAEGAVDYSIVRTQSGVATTLGPATGTHFADTGLRNGRTVSYVVNARNQDGTPTPSTTVTVTPLAPPRDICVSSSLDDSVHVFRSNAEGIGSPHRTLAGNSLLSDPVDAAVDGFNDAILVLDASGSKVLAFSLMDRTPLRELADPAWSAPTAITIDAVRGELWVADGDGTVYAYAATDAGTGTQLRSVATGQTAIVDLDIDPIHGELFTASATQVKAWPVTTTTSHLLRRYPKTGSFTGLRAVAYLPGWDRLAFGEVFSAQESRLRSARRCGTTCVEAGDVQQHTSLSYARIFNFAALQYDRKRERILALSDAYKSAGPMMYVWGLSAGGTPGTIALSARSDFTLTAPAPVTGMTLDTERDQYWLAGGTYARAYDLADLDGDALRSVGTTNGLSLPRRIVSDSANGELYVLNAGSGAITVFPWNTDGAVSPTRTVTATGGEPFDGELVYAESAGKVFARAGTTTVVGFPRTADGTVDVTTAERIAEAPWKLSALAWDAVQSRLVGHAHTGANTYGFYSWNASLGTALWSANDALLIGSDNQSLAAHAGRLRLLYSLGNLRDYTVSGTSITNGGIHFISGYTSPWSTLLHDTRNHQLLVGIGGRIYTIPDEPETVAITPDRELNVSASVGNDIRGMAFCSP